MALCRDSLLEYIHSKLGVSTDQLTSETVLFSEGLVDSFKMVELIAHIEKEEGIRMSAADVHLTNLDSIDKILAYLERVRTTP